MRNLIILALLLVSTGIIAQDYDEQIRIGNNHLTNNLYEEAIDAYLTAQILEPTKIDNIRERVKGVYLKINKLKDSTLTLNKKLDTTIIVLEQKNFALDSTTQVAIKSRNEALKQKAIAEANLYSFKAKQYLNQGKSKFKMALDTATLATVSYTHLTLPTNREV